MSHNKVYTGFCNAIGNTPLIRLRGFSEALGSEILGKAEFLNPGGSVKDRTALEIVEDAERRGLLKPGGTLVEGTAGNTGIGLTLVANAKGYRSIIVIPNNQSVEKIELLRALGADVRLVPPAPFSEPGNYNKIAARIAEEVTGGFWANQFDNRANAEAHFKTTGPEIWKQTEGKVTAFATAVGTGGTLNGTARYLKSQNPNIHVLCPDPYGAAMWSWFTHGHTDIDDGDSIAEGIGQGRVTENVKDTPVDSSVRVNDRILVEIVHYLLREEGLFLGTSSGVNIAGALRAALDLGKGQTVVTILADGAQRYMSRLFNKEWLAENELTPEGWGVEQIIDAVRLC